MSSYDSFTMEKARDLIAKADISVEEMLTFLPITKQTYYNWVNGRTVRDQLRFKLTASRFAILERAVDRGLLPLPEFVPKRARLQLIREAFAKAK